MSPQVSTSVAHGERQLGIAVAEILRVSTEEQAADNRAGLDRQRATNRRTIELKGLRVVRTVELHVSGTIAAGHPEMIDVFRMISNSEIKGIVVADLDRLCRPDEPSGYAVLQVFKDMGAKIFAGDAEYDLTTSNGLLHGSMRAMIAGFELNLIKERMQGAKEAKRRAGKFPTNELTLPMGVFYNRKADTWGYTSEVGIVKMLFDKFLSGTRNFTELGRLAGITGAGVKAVLRNRIYTGWRIIDKKRGGPKRFSKSGKMYRAKIARADEDVIRVKVLEPLITEEQYELIQREMAQAKFNHIQRFRSNDAVNIGTGLAVCGCCGQSLFCVSGRGPKRAGEKIGYYQCKANHYAYKNRLGGCKQRHLRSADLDAAIILLVTMYLCKPETLAAILEASEKKSRAVITPFAKAVTPSAQIEELARRDKRLLDAFEAGAISVDELKDKRAAIRREKATLEMAFAPKASVTKDGFMQLARQIVKAVHRFPSLTDKRQQKAIAHELLSEIHFRQAAIVAFRFRPSAFAGTSVPGATGELVLLPDPIVVGPAPDVLPDGHRRCTKCRTVKPTEVFFEGTNRCVRRCDTCRSAEARARYLRHKAEAAS